MDKNNSKHKILLLASGYKYSGSANGVCARNLVREFVRQGHEVYVIAVPHNNETDVESHEGAKVWFVKDELQTRILTYLQQHKTNAFMRCIYKYYSLVRALLVAPLYPNAARIRVHNILKISNKIIKKYGIDTVIGTCLPYDGIAASMILKKKYGARIRVVTYHFDILSTPNNDAGAIYAFKKKRFAKAFIKELQIVDRVFLPETAKDLHRDKGNIRYIGLPVYLPETTNVIDCPIQFSHDVYNIVYIGSLDVRNRSVQPAIDLLRKLNQKSKKKYLLHIWGCMTDGDTKIIVEKSNDVVEYHGMLENEKVKSVMKNADFLLNISNSLLYKLLPSKIFTMFSTGKPIINIINNVNDCSLSYFKKYRNVFSINVKDIKHCNADPSCLFNNSANADKLFIAYMPLTITKKLLGDD